MRFVLTRDGKRWDLTRDVIHLGPHEAGQPGHFRINLVGADSYAAICEPGLVGAVVPVEVDAAPGEVAPGGDRRVHVTEPVSYRGKAFVRAAEEHPATVGNVQRHGPGYTMVSLRLELVD